jgi:dienelactone hydrolase
MLLIILRIVVGVLALAAILVSLGAMRANEAGLTITRHHLGPVPVTLYQPAGSERAPAVVAAHGFAGSQQMMQQFATTLAQAGFVAVTFDFPGHGHNTEAMAGGITDDRAASHALLGALDQVVGFARAHPAADGRVALVGHSMAAHIVLRYALANPAIAATVAISTMAPDVTPTEPARLLAIVGAWEPPILRNEVARIVALAAPGTVREGVVAAGVEHIGVIYATETLAATRAWLARTFERTAEGPIDARGGWIGLLFLGLVALCWPLAALLPRVAPDAPALEVLAAPLGWRRVWPVLVLPALATPLLLRLVPTNFLPLLLGDYLAVHFVVYGALTMLAFFWRRIPVARPEGALRRLALAALLVAAWQVLAFGLPLEAYVTAFVPVGPRVWLVGAMLLATLPWFAADELFTRAPGAPRWLYAATKVAFLVSLALAVALDLRRLFFLIIIIPVILILFVVYGLISRWVFRATGHPLVAAFGNAVALAWAIAVTFPMVAR